MIYILIALFILFSLLGYIKGFLDAKEKTFQKAKEYLKRPQKLKTADTKNFEVDFEELQAWIDFSGEEKKKEVDDE